MQRKEKNGEERERDQWKDERECERQEEKKIAKERNQERSRGFNSITEYLTTSKLVTNAQSGLFANGASFHRCLSRNPFAGFGFLWRETMLLVG